MKTAAARRPIAGWQRIERWPAHNVVGGPSSFYPAGSPSGAGAWPVGRAVNVPRPCVRLRSHVT
ncbi:hypothetical protein [Amycolatopsis sp. cmx-11-51]|uniref:hypothetical protein n=1 Tax=unclassified Amycolatopsis TaxID=2618356 RepID=UPI0039E35EA4